MMQMESLPMQPEEFPSAIVLARLADVVVNNNVLYRLVQPTEQGTEVLSVNRLVNVVPFRRVYRFDRKEELNEFANELLRRPLVLQPVVHFGRGLGSGSLTCGMCYKDDKWIMLVNQTHPKILGRLQIGLDAAKNAMARGQSCEIRFAFSQLVEKLYKDNLSRKEQEDAAQTLDLIKSYFRYSEWEYGDLIIRHHGYAARFGRGGGISEMSTLHLTFLFEDLMTQEIQWKNLGAEYFPKSHLAPVSEDEIRDTLPAWTVNGVSPLENIGEQVPATNYSYSQAGRLYESFRKKKRHRPQAEMGDQAEVGAGAPAVRPTVTDGIELKVMEQDDRWQQHSPSGGGYLEQHPDQYRGTREDQCDDRVGYDTRRPQHNARQWQEHVEDDGFYEGQGAKPKRNPQYDNHGHIYPEVKVTSGQTGKSGSHNPRSPVPVPNSYPHTNTSLTSHSNAPRDQFSNHYASPSQKNQTTNPYARPSPSQDEHEYSSHRDQFTRLRMHGSDRSSHSEAGSGVADSGVCSDSDGHVREGSYEKPLHKNSPAHPYAMDNHAFHDDEPNVDEALRKHKELVAKMMGGAQQGAEPARVQHKFAFSDSRQQSYVGDYVNRNGSAPRAKGGVPSPLSVPAQHYDPTDSRNAHYGQANYSPSAQSPRQPIEESFI
ncbi:hypothetical protein ACOMHN_006065 [Nucella lapillus]